MKKFDSEYRCGDCGGFKNKLHFINCDLEVCPKCKGQLLSCIMGKNKCKFTHISLDNKTLLDTDGNSWKRNKIK